MAGETLTKARLVEALNSQVGITKKEAGELVETVIDLMRESLVDGEKVKISGFGHWYVADKAARKGRNPQTNEPIIIARHRVLKWKTSPVLRARLNEEQ